MAGSVANNAAAVERSLDRITRLLRSGLDGTQPVKGLSWTVRDLAAHLVSGGVAYRQMAEGGPSPYLDVELRRETNQERLEAEGERDLSALADRIDAEVSQMVTAMRSRSDDAVAVWHGGIPLPVPAFLGSVVGELVFHGRDLARTVGEPWPIARRDTLPIVDFFNAVTPYMVDERAARGITATFEVRFRGYETTTFAFDDGQLSVRSGPATRADVRMSVDPASFLLVGYKRAGLAVPILTGRALAWGRRPWLALRFAGLFQAP